MTKRLMLALVGSTVALAMVVALLPATVVAQDDEVHKRTIVIKKMGDGDGLHEVHEGEHNVIFVGEDGEATEIHGDGEGFRWVKGPHGTDMTFAFGGLGSGAFLGVGTAELTPELRSHFGVSENLGVMVSKVIDDSGAFSAGVLVGDIITGVDGEEIDSGHDLRAAIRDHEEGDSVTLEIWRDSKAQQITAILGKTENQFSFLPEGHFAHSMKIDCDDETEDCNIWMSKDIEACEGDDECEVKVSCDDGDCTCYVNGEEADCEGLDGIHLQHDD